MTLDGLKVVWLDRSRMGCGPQAFLFFATDPPKTFEFVKLFWRQGCMHYCLLKYNPFILSVVRSAVFPQSSFESCDCQATFEKISVQIHQPIERGELHSAFFKRALQIQKALVQNFVIQYDNKGEVLKKWRAGRRSPNLLYISQYHNTTLSPFQCHVPVPLNKIR